MILANTNGTLCAVQFVEKKRGNTIVREICGGTTFTLKPNEINRKLFDGDNACAEAEQWVLQQRADRKKKNVERKRQVILND